MFGVSNSVPSTGQDNQFLERTINGNFKINLNKRNIIDIALIKYGYGANQGLIFKVFDEKELQGLLQELKEYINDNTEIRPLIIVLNNKYLWSTIMVCNTMKSAYYLNYYNDQMPHELNAEFNQNEIEVNSLVVSNKYTKTYDSGIISLETAVNLYNNKDQLLSGNMLLNDILLNNLTDMIEKRKTLVNCLQIMQIQKIKLYTLSSNLTKELKQINSNTVDFNYSNANAFLHFLETFALQDLHMKDIEPEYKLYLKNIISSDDIDCVACIRSKLLIHRNDANDKPDIIKPEHLKVIINSNFSSNIYNFFQNVSTYVFYILSIIQGASIYGGQIIRPHQFLEQNITKVGDDIEQEAYNAQINVHLESFFTKAFSTPSYRNDKQAHDEEQQSIFDLIVNFAPYFDNAFNKRKEILKEMRNIQIHEFYRYSDQRFATEYALTNYLRENKNSLFKCCYSRYVYPELKEFNELLKQKKNNKASIEKKKIWLCSSLETFLEEHKTKISLQQFNVQNQVTHVDSQNELERGFRVQVSTSTNVQNDDHDKIKETVEHYFKLLLFIANEGPKDNAGPDIDDEAISRRYKNLKYEQILKIQTDLDHLRRLKLFLISTQSVFEKQYEIIQEYLKQQFKIDYGIMEEDFDSLVALIDESDAIRVSKYHYFIEHITKHVDIINNQQKEYKCSIKDIINMYRERRELSFNRGSLEEKIGSLPPMKLWKVNIFIRSSDLHRNVTTQVNPDRFVTIIYEIINKVSQKPISNDINEVFNDCEFLDYLGKQNIFFPNLMKECLDFTIPLIARVISLPEYGIKIDDAGFCNTIKKLVNEDNIVHLKPIITKVYKLKGNQHMKTKFLEKICTHILENYNSTKNIEYLDKIFNNANIANDIIGIYLTKWEESGMSEDGNLKEIIMNIVNTLVGTSFTIACDFKNYDRALELLTKDNINKAVAQMEHIAQDLYWSTKINIARFHHKTKNNKECIKVLQETLRSNTTQEGKPFYFLALSYMAKIQNKDEHYEDAINNYCKLHTEFVEYILGNTPTAFNLTVYNDMIQHEKYKNAQKVSSKYLEVLRIKSDMAYTLCKINQYKDALDIYEEILSIQNGQCDKYNKEIIKTRRNIGYVSFSLGIKMNAKSYEATCYYVKALANNKKVFELQSKKHWVNHPAVNASFLYVLKTYKDIIKIKILRREMFDDFEQFCDLHMANIKTGLKELEIKQYDKIIDDINRIYHY